MPQNTLEPKFCNKCGEKLLVSDKIGEYDVFTGEKVIVSKTFRCPHYNSIFGRLHFKITMRFDVDESIEHRYN